MRDRKTFSNAIDFSHLPDEQRWEACVNELKFNYTLSPRDMCQILKCSRTWFNTYIKPQLKYIYISNGMSSGKKGANFLLLASILLDREMTSTTYYNAKDFYKLIKDNITSITRQTIKIPIEMLIDNDKLEYFNKNYKSLADIKNDFLKDFNIDKYREELRTRSNVLRDSVSEIGSEIISDLPIETFRTDTEHITCNLNLTNADILRLDAAHDLKGYGGTDEEVYRKFFNNGYYKLKLEIPDVTGKKSDKVFYLLKKEFDGIATKELINIKYSNYLKYF